MRQAEFARALLNPEAALPDGLCGPDGLPDPRRFQVYRNNVAASLSRALEAAFPVLRQLVGAEFFAALALAFQQKHPPRQRQLMLYGAEMPAFLADFAPVAHLGYLPDIARLEQAIRESYHSADSHPLPAERLATLTEAELLSARISLQPAMRLLASDWPVLSIWLAHSGNGPAPVMRPEEVAILRPVFDPVPCLLPKGGATFLRRLQQGQSLGAALEEVPEGFDLSAMLSILLQHNALTEITPCTA